MVSPISAKGHCEVKVDIKNTGDLAGKDVVQIYVKDLVSSSVRPALELKGYTKLRINPGQIETVSVKLHKDAFKFFDERRDGWTAGQGQFEVLVGSTLKVLKNKAGVTLDKTLTWTSERY
jgi:beta-glucosidase